MDPRYEKTAHTRMICDRLDALARGDIRKLMLFVPPRHGKTYHAGERFPAYCFGQNPSWQIITTSYTIDLARASSRKARNIMREETWPFPDVELAEDTQGAEEWRLTDGGVMKAAGVGGSITGFGAHLLIIDDPVKGRAEAESATYRQNAWEWYTDVARTRVMRDGRQLVMMTRWHEDDLAGRILASSDGPNWEVLRLPAIAEEDDPLGREVGAALWPGGMADVPDPALIGSRSFSALYQGSPKPAQGTLFKREWFANRYKTLPSNLKRGAIFVDGAWKDGVGNDRSAMAVWLTNGIDYFVHDAFAGRMEYPELKLKVAAFWDRHKLAAPTMKPLVEDAASGIPLIQEFSRSTNIPIIGVKVDKSKYVRAEAVTPEFESGRVYLPEGAAWLDEWIEEHIAFPSVKHDDFVDTTSGALGYIKGSNNFAFAESF